MQTMSDNITKEDYSGNLSSMSGNIKIVKGNGNYNTMSGNIYADDVVGNLTSMSGNIDIKNSQVTEVSTMSGNIYLAHTTAQKVSSHSGTVFMLDSTVNELTGIEIIGSGHINHFIVLEVNNTNVSITGNAKESFNLFNVNTWFSKSINISSNVKDLDIIIPKSIKVDLITSDYDVKAYEQIPIKGKGKLIILE